MLKTPKLILEVCEWSESIANRSKRSLGVLKGNNRDFVHWHRNSESLRDAKISHRRLQKVELGSHNVKKLKFYHLRYPDNHKDPARQKKKF